MDVYELVSDVSKKFYCSLVTRFIGQDLS